MDTREATEALITALDRREPDHVAVVVAMRPLVAPTVWAELAEAWSICPVHNRHEAECEDAQAECPAGNGAPA